MKTKRQSAILDIIARYDVETQEELAKRLQKQGIAVTQATVSRDIKELRLIKVLAADGRYKYASVESKETVRQERFNNLFAHAVLSINTTGNLIVVKTMAGAANAASEAIDSLNWREIVGTIAGDNTIFVAVSEKADVRKLVARFRSMMEK